MEQLPAVSAPEQLSTAQMIRKYSVGARQIMRLRALCADNATLAEMSECVGLTADVCELVIQHFSMRAVMSDKSTPAELELATKRRRERLAIWQETVAAKAGDAALNGFELATAAVGRDDAKGFADAARGVSAFTQLARQAEGLDSEAKQSGPGSISLALFVVQPGVQAIEVETREVLVPQVDAGEPAFD